MKGIIILCLLVHLSLMSLGKKKKILTRQGNEVMNSSIQSSICISEVLTCLMSIGVKRNMLSLQKLNRKKGRAFKISHCLWLSSGGGNPTDILICLQIKKKCLSFQHVLFYFYYSFHKNKKIRYEKIHLNWILLGDV